MLCFNSLSPGGCCFVCEQITFKFYHQAIFHVRYYTLICAYMPLLQRETEQKYIPVSHIMHYICNQHHIMLTHQNCHAWHVILLCHESHFFTAECPILKSRTECGQIRQTGECRRKCVSKQLLVRVILKIIMKLSNPLFSAGWITILSIVYRSTDRVASVCSYSHTAGKSEFQRIHTPQIAKFTGTTWGPPGSCRPRWAPCGHHEPCYLGR